MHLIEGPGALSFAQPLHETSLCRLNVFDFMTVFFFMTVDSAYVGHNAKSSDPVNADTIDPLSDEKEIALAQLIIAKTVYDAHQAFSGGPHGIRDCRFVKAKLSLAHWMLTIAGTIKTDHPRQSSQPMLDTTPKSTAQLMPTPSMPSQTRKNRPWRS
ncbi:MAG: hypothetical protein LQ347_003259 [Umbilicaria vellea]|nr:MAG: hypothetical protein LQ347_003259 [Umbilicaria vellea]